MLDTLHDANGLRHTCVSDTVSIPKLLIPLSQFSELGGRLPLGNIEGFFEEELLNRDFLLATHWYTSLNQTSLSQLFSLGGVEER